MIKKLRIKFIVVAMCALTIVLALIVGVINVKTYRRVINESDSTIEIIYQNGGIFPKTPFQKAGFSPEQAYETRFFTVTFDNKGEIILVNTDNIVAINMAQAKEIATKLYNNGTKQGVENDYRFKAFTVNNDQILYIFLNCENSLSSYRDFMQSVLIICAIGIVAVFILVVIFSYFVMKPVAKTYAKQQQFITDANHELKTPLTVIGASCDLMEYNGGKTEWTETIKEQVFRLKELTDKLVFLSRVDEESFKKQMSEFSLSEVVEESLKPYKAIIENQQKTLDIEIENNLSINGDIEMIRQLIRLLMDNAVKYSTENSKISFKLKQAGKVNKIEIENYSDNIPDGNLDKLFERFYRPDQSRNSGTGGHGIGLSVVKAIVDVHKGKVSAYSPDKKKIIFTVII